MMTRSLENAVYSVTANRIGSEARGGKEELRFTGKSQIVDPAGQVLMSLDSDEEGVEAVEVDIARARDKSITSRNDRFKDRRPELYKAT
jgi:predicted amidohydrolase